MDVLEKILLILHILAGFAALAMGLMAILAKKGKALHRLGGKIYFWSMVMVVITAVILSLFKDIAFLLMIAIFSFYLCYTGYRATLQKQLKPNFPDWLIMALAMMNAGFMLASLNAILMVFAGLSIVFGTQDLAAYFGWRKQSKSNNWLTMHIGRMLGAYISTLTASLVVNVQVEPTWLIWLAPTFVGTLLIAFYIARVVKVGLKGV